MSTESNENLSNTEGSVTCRRLDELPTLPEYAEAASDDATRPPGSYCDDGQFLTPKQVAALLHVTTKTVNRWAQSGKVSSTRTVGGHHRYRSREIYALVRALETVDQMIDHAEGLSHRNALNETCPVRGAGESTEEEPAGVSGREC